MADEKPPESEKEPRLRAYDEEIDLKVRNPWPWLIMAAVPLFLGIVIMLRQPDAPTVTERAAAVSPKVLWKERIDAKTKSGVPNVRTIPGTDRPAVALQPEEKDYPCDFAPWVGMRMEEDILQAVRQVNRPYRILLPGAPMTMDFSPARINFDVNKKNVITRVWCG
jgi:hypothetical protein